MKHYEIRKDANEKPYDIARGSWELCIEAFDINYSTILTKLIQEAGRWCEHHASDLFLYWESLERELSNERYKGDTYVFGFREQGVDSKKEILTNLNTNEYSAYYYRAVWQLEVQVMDNGYEIEMRLYKVELR